MKKGSDDSAALGVRSVHQRVEVRQQGVPGLQDVSRVLLKGRVPGHRVLSLQG